MLSFRSHHQSQTTSPATYGAGAVNRSILSHDLGQLLSPPTTHGANIGISDRSTRMQEHIRRSLHFDFHDFLANVKEMFALIRGAAGSPVREVQLFSAAVYFRDDQPRSGSYSAIPLPGRAVRMAVVERACICDMRQIQCAMKAGNAGAQLARNVGASPAIGYRLHDRGYKWNRSSGLHIGNRRESSSEVRAAILRFSACDASKNKPRTETHHSLCRSHVCGAAACLAGVLTRPRNHAARSGENNRNTSPIGNSLPRKRLKSAVISLQER